MLELPLFALLFSAILSENIALYYFLGICPLLSISSDLRASFQMGMAVTIVMLVTMALNWPVYFYLLQPHNLEYLQLLFFILIIAASVQILEQLLERFLPMAHQIFGIFLPLITVNCAILGVSLFAALREYSFEQAMIYSVGSGLGWCLVICLMASLRRRLNETAISVHLGKTGVSMLIAAVLALAFSGLTELLGGDLL